ncbi:unannotated protein [freshwater metagenome]|uniref:Unannotated protein n=1 Tax=freshwater metagenome TaxID=449393 RepID=A0A6J7GM43_9ZZZZ
MVRQDHLFVFVRAYAVLGLGKFGDLFDYRQIESGTGQNAEIVRNT